MKKIFAPILLSLIFVPQVFAELEVIDDWDDYDDSYVTVDDWEDDQIQNQYDETDYEQNDFFIADEPGLLTGDQLYDLDQRLRNIAQKYGIGVYVVIINDYENFAGSVESAAERIYENYNFGLGPERSMLELLLSMNDRSYDLDAHGYGREAFDSRKNRLIDSFLDNFRNNDWAGGIYDFVNTAERYLENDRANGVNYEEVYLQSRMAKEKQSNMILVFVAVLVALIFAIARLASEKKKMKNVAMATDANSYVSSEGIEFSIKNDAYRYSTTHTRIIESSSRSGGFSGGGGHSHSSGHF